MAYYAKVVDNKVVKVICADSSYFNDFVDDTPGEWLETFKDGSQRSTFAGVGHVYDRINDAFHPPKPHSGWTLNTSNHTWNPPSDAPNDGKIYGWDEENETWAERT